MMYRATVAVRPREGVLDPQGQTIRGALSALGYERVAGVTVGKLIDLELEAVGEIDARRMLEEMSDRLLANPVLEQYVIMELTPVGGAG